MKRQARTSKVNERNVAYMLQAACAVCHSLQKMGEALAAEKRGHVSSMMKTGDVGSQAE